MQWFIYNLVFFFFLGRGFLQFGNVSYGIEPLESSIGFEHVIYQLEPKKRDVLLYAEKDIGLRNQKYKIQSVMVGD